MYYNLACARARLKEFDRCWEALKSASDIGQVKEKAVNKDVEPNEDLGEFAVDPRFQAQFIQLRKKLSRNATEGARSTAVEETRPVKKGRFHRAWSELMRST